jgi:hypothetical protein
MTTNFDDAFKSFFAGCEKIYNDNCDRQGFSMRDGFRFEIGTRYVKVIRGTGVHCFVDTKNGDVLKAAYKRPKIMYT